nr:ATP-binding cassette domain-containing protein [Brachyspira hyodysenteriae]
MSYLYEIKDISKIYGHGGGATQALKSVNLTIEEGKLTAILGPSGSGKSTLLNILGALDKPTSGQVLFWERISLITVIKDWQNLEEKI